MKERLATLARALCDYLTISRSGLFDAEWYLKTNADVATSGRNPLWHYVRSGAFEGRAASRDFETRWYRDTYLTAFPAQGLNPLVHFERYGRSLGLKSGPARDGKQLATATPEQMAADVRAVRLASAADDDLGKAGISKLGLIALGAGTPSALERLQQIAEDFVARGGETVTLVQRDEHVPRFARSGGIIRTDGSTLGALRWAPLPDVAKRIRAPRPALFIAADPESALAVADRLKPAGSRLAVLVDERLSLRPDIETALLFEIGDAFVFSTPAALQDAQVIKSFPADRCVVEPFRPEASNIASTDPAAPIPSDILIVGVGDDPLRDGLDLFVAAAARVAAKQKRARFVWVGPLRDDDVFVRSVREDIARFGLKDAVTFLGERRSLAPVFRQAHVFAFLARNNFSARPLRGVAAAGIPTVCFAGSTAAESVSAARATVVAFGRTDDAAKEILRLAKPPKHDIAASQPEPVDLAGFIEAELGWPQPGQRTGE